MSLVDSVLGPGLVFVVLMRVTPILLAAIGGAITQQANILTIGLEGMMLVGAFAAVTVGLATGSWALGLLGAVGAGLALAAVYAVCTLGMKADFIVVGIGVNILAGGVTTLLLQIIYGNPGSTSAAGSVLLPRLSLGPVGRIPVIGPEIADLTPLVWLALVLVPVYSVVLYRTRFGVHLRAVGQDLPAALAAGIDPTRMKLWAILLSGVLSGLAGAQLSMGTLGSFNAGMTSGRGFIAVAALTFGRGRPLRTLVAALIFGTADAVADRLGLAGVNSNLALMTPYIITIVALTLAAIAADRRGSRPRTAAR